MDTSNDVINVEFAAILFIALPAKKAFPCAEKEPLFERKRL